MFSRHAMRDGVWRCLATRGKTKVDTALRGRLSALLADESPIPKIDLVLPDGSNVWTVTPATARFLARLVIEQQRRRILEFGAGASSLVFAHALQRIGGGTLTSVEQNPEWCAETWAEVERVPSVDARLATSRLNLTVTLAGVYYSYSGAAGGIAERGPYDLALIDGPQSYYGRDGSLHLAYDHLSAGALIVLDDARRKGEQWSLRRWLRTYPGLELSIFEPELAGHGVAVLRYTGQPGRRLSASAFLSSAYDVARRWPARRRAAKYRMSIRGARNAKTASQPARGPARSSLAGATPDTAGSEDMRREERGEPGNG